MRKFKFALLLILLIVYGLCSVSGAGVHSKKTPAKKGILLVTFGTSVPRAQAAFKHIEDRVKAAYPGLPVRWAYTSTIIRKKLARKGQFLDSPEVALAKMMDEGVTQVAVQSLHTIPGEEFHDLTTNALLFGNMAGGFQKIGVGLPLLGTEKDISRVVDGMIRHIPKKRGKSDAVIFMGHGTPHPANAFYAALMYHFQRKDPNIYVGTVEGWPDIQNIRDMLIEKKIKKAYLIPFMSVAGDHAMNDMAGNEDDSWKSILTKSGIECVTVMKGTADYDEIIDIWVDHIGDIFNRLK